jgi:hypothetical protein
MENLKEETNAKVIIKYLKASQPWGGGVDPPPPKKKNDTSLSAELHTSWWLSFVPKLRLGPEFRPNS